MLGFKVCQVTGVRFETVQFVSIERLQQSGSEEPLNEPAQSARAPCCLKQYVSLFTGGRDCEGRASGSVDVHLAKDPSRFRLCDPLTVAVGAPAR